MRLTRLLTLAAVPVALALSAAPAGAQQWLPIPDLKAPDASWVREYSTAPDPARHRLRLDRGQRRLALGEQRPRVEGQQRRPQAGAGRDAGPHGHAQRHLDRLRGHDRGPVQVRRRRRLAAARPGAGGRPEEADQAPQARAGALLAAGRQDARGRRLGRRVLELRRRCHLAAARAGQRHVVLRDGLEHRLADPGRAVRGHRQRRLPLDQQRLDVDARLGWHHRHDPARLRRREAPEHVLCVRHRRRLPHDQRAASRGPTSRARSATSSAAARCAASCSCPASTRRACTRAPRTASTPARPATACSPARCAGARSTTRASATTRSSGR